MCQSAARWFQPQEALSPSAPSTSASESSRMSISAVEVIVVHYQVRRAVRRATCEVRCDLHAARGTLHGHVARGTLHRHVAPSHRRTSHVTRHSEPIMPRTALFLLLVLFAQLSQPG